MSKQQPVAKGSAEVVTRTNRWMDIATSHIAKTTGLVVALGGLGAAVLAQYDTVMKPSVQQAPVGDPVATTSTLPGARVADCLTVNPPKFPDKAVYKTTLGSWDGRSTVEFSGRNDCGPGVGVYLAFKATSNVLTLSAPGLGTRECEKPSFHEPVCWDSWAPVEANDDKTWVLRFGLPDASPRDDANMIDGQLRISYQLRRLNGGAVLRAGRAEAIPVSFGN